MSRTDQAPPLVRSGGPPSLVLLGLRGLLAADLVRLCVRRWTALDASLRTLEVGGFPAPETWLATGLLAGGVGVGTLLAGWRARWGAALTLLLFVPLAGVYTVSYVPTGWGAGLGPVIPFLAMAEKVLLGLGLMGIFFFGAGTYTLPRGLRAVGRAVRALKPRTPMGHVSVEAKKQTAQQ